MEGRLSTATGTGIIKKKKKKETKINRKDYILHISTHPNRSLHRRRLWQESRQLTGKLREKETKRGRKKPEAPTYKYGHILLPKDWCGKLDGI